MIFAINLTQNRKITQLDENDFVSFEHTVESVFGNKIQFFLK